MCSISPTAIEILHERYLEYLRKHRSSRLLFNPRCREARHTPTLVCVTERGRQVAGIPSLTVYLMNSYNGIYVQNHQPKRKK